MAFKYNIAERPFTVVLRRGKDELRVILWAEDKESLMERLKEELSEKTEVVRIEGGSNG